jgi:hypothetical protein
MPKNRLKNALKIPLEKVKKGAKTGYKYMRLL